MATHRTQNLEYSLGNFSKEEQQHIATFMQDLKEGRKIERGAIRKWLKDDFYIVPATEMPELLGVNEKEIESRAKQGEFPARQGHWKFRYFDLRNVLRFMWKKKIESAFDVDKELKQRRITGEEIKNKIKMGRWISKEKAEDRSTRILQAAMNMIQFAIKKASPQLVGCPSPSEAEKVLAMKFREATELLKQEAESKEWAKEISEETEIYFEDEQK